MPGGPPLNRMRAMNRTVSRGAAAIQALCAQRLSAETLVPAVLEALHRLVPSSRNLFDWTDARGRLLRYYFEGPIDATIAQLYFDEFHNRREAEAMPAFDALARTPMGIHSAAALDTPAFFASALYREIWRPQGLKYRVEAVLRGRDGTLIGSLVLYRGPDDTCFTSAEERRLAQVLPAFGAALERAGQAEAAARHVPSPDPVESLVLGMDQRVRHATPGAHRLLLLASGGVSRDALAQPLDRLASLVLAPLLQRLGGHSHMGVGCAAAAHTVPPLPELRLSNAWGQFVVRARLLTPTASVETCLLLVDLVRQEPHSVALARRLGQLPLTPGQAQVCAGLVQGQSQACIARQLGVAPATVVDHVRKSYRALGVNSALELQALVERPLA